MRILVYGYGNPGRQDDGLGILFAEAIEDWAEKHTSLDLAVDMNYQLNIEDALTISEYDIIFFVDASMEVIEDFLISKVKPSDKVNFSMHSVSASYIAYLCNEIYKKTPKIFLIHLKGYEWELKEGITDKARKNLQNALSHFLGILKQPDKIGDISKQISD